MIPKLTYKVRSNIDGEECIAPFINDKNVWDIPVKYWSEPVQSSIISAYGLGYSHAKEMMLESLKHYQPYIDYIFFQKEDD